MVILGGERLGIEDFVEERQDVVGLDDAAGFPDLEDGG